MVKDIIKRAKAYIFDFDGTLFHLFTTFSFDKELKEIREEYKRLGFSFPETWNPFDAFKCVFDEENTIENRNKALLIADKILTKKELEAINSGYEVKGTLECLKYLIANNIKFSIASNNSPLAIKAYLDSVLPGNNIPVVGRIPGRPDLLKPNPWMLEELIKKMDVKSEDVVFLGDHPRDLDCANRAGVMFIGITPADYKRERMLNILPADSICNDIEELLNIIRA